MREAEGRLVRAVIPVVFSHNDSRIIVVKTPDFEADVCWQEREKRETRALLFSYETIACYLLIHFVRTHFLTGR